MKTFIKKYYKEILSMIVPLTIFLLSMLINHYFPFGEKSFALYDAQSQYPGFFSYYKEVLLGKESLLYSFKGLLGYNFLATASYYLFNPTFLLLIFFNNSTLLEFYTIIVLLRISLSGLTMCKYLKYKFKNKSNYIIFFSMAYALMSYNVAYFFNFMYFDSIVLFPLVMIGIEKIINENKNTLYIITLALSILSNFYIGYMICIFSVIYFSYNYYLTKNKNKKTIKMFIISSLLSGIICSFLLIPTIYELLQGKADLFKNEVQTNYFSFNLNFIKVFYKMTPGSFTADDIKYSGINIYSSLLSLVLTIKYFLNKNISKKEKKATLIVICFFLLSISFNLIDYSWHMFQKPIWYPHRYIFTFTFFILTISYKSFITEENINTKQKLIILLSLTILFILPNLSLLNNNIKLICLIFSILLLMQYLFINKKTIIFSLFILEIFINTTITLQFLSLGTKYSEYKANNEIYEKVTEYIKPNQNDFYRAELSTNINSNPGATYNYNGINYFNSLKNGKVMNFFDKKLKYDVTDSSILKYNFNNPYINSLLSIKYFTGSSKEDYYKLVFNDGIYLYENQDALPLIFKAHENITAANLIDNNNLENTKIIVNSLLNENLNIYYKLENFKLTNIKIENNYIKKINAKEESYITYEGLSEESGFLILNKSILLYITPDIEINNKNASSYIYSNETPIFLNKGDKYKITYKTITDYPSQIADLYFMPYSDYRYFIDSIKKDLSLEEYQKDNYIKGIIDTNQDNTMYFTTVPYDKGWSIKTNNKKISYEKCLDTFICFKANKGKNIIELSYTPVGLKIGTIISIITLFITIIYTYKNNRV